MADPIGHVCEEIRSISVLNSSNLRQFGKITRAETLTYIQNSKLFTVARLSNKLFGTHRDIISYNISHFEI